MVYQFIVNKNEFTVCVRSSGEFTTDRLIQDIIHQIGSNEKVHLIKNLMLHEAIDRSFEFAIQDKSLWLITLDADLVIKKDFFDIYSKIANSMRNREIESHAMTVDRLFMKYRSAGNRLYRVDSLPLLRNLLVKTKNDIRPEGSMLNEAVKLGYKLKPTNDVVAMHDFFQFSRDLFRKGYICSFKHLAKSSKLLSNWRNLAEDSVDFSILLRGFAFGLANGNKPIQDTRSTLFQSTYEELSREFYEYDHNLIIPENLEFTISEVISNKYFSSTRSGLLSKTANLVWRRIFES